MTADELIGSAWRLTTLPLALGADVARDGIDAGERAGRALALSGQGALLRLLDTVTDALIGDEVLDRVLARIEEAGVIQRVAQHVLESGVVEEVTERVLNGPELRNMLRSAFGSDLPDEVVAQLLASEAVWVLVDELVTSPAVTEAITHQSAGFIEQVGSKARDRSRSADARLQRLVLSRLGHRRNPSAPTEPLPGQAGGEGAG